MSNYQVCSTNVEKYKISHKWIINKFSFWLDVCSEESFQLKSSTVSTGVRVNFWNVILYMNGTNTSNSDYMSYSIDCQSYKKSDPTTASGEIWIENAKSGRKEFVNAFILYLFIGSNNIVRYNNVIQKSVIRNRSDEFLPNDKLTICLEITLYCPINSTISTTVPAPSTQMIRDYEELYETKKCSDVVIVIGEKKIKAHKAILSARCAVFSAMFENDMTEKGKNKVVIEDVEADVFEELLRYIYTDQAPDTSAISIDLLAAADKYGLEILKNICESALCNTITGDNAAALFVLAERHDGRQLMTKLMDFINANSNVLETQGFKEMEEKYPRLLAKLYRSVIAKPPA